MELLMQQQFAVGNGYFSAMYTNDYAEYVECKNIIICIIYYRYNICIIYIYV